MGDMEGEVHDAFEYLLSRRSKEVVPAVRKLSEQELVYSFGGDTDTEESEASVPDNGADGVTWETVEELAKEFSLDVTMDTWVHGDGERKKRRRKPWDRQAFGRLFGWEGEGAATRLSVTAAAEDAAAFPHPSADANNLLSTSQNRNRQRWRTVSVATDLCRRSLDTLNVKLAPPPNPVPDTSSAAAMKSYVASLSPHSSGARSGGILKQASGMLGPPQDVGQMSKRRAHQPSNRGTGNVLEELLALDTAVKRPRTAQQLAIRSGGTQVWRRNEKAASSRTQACSAMLAAGYYPPGATRGSLYKARPRVSPYFDWKQSFPTSHPLDGDLPRRPPLLSSTPLRRPPTLGPLKRTGTCLNTTVPAADPAKKYLTNIY